MTFSCTDLSFVEPGLLATLVNGLHNVYIKDTQLTKQQVEEIFVGLTGQTKLKGLGLVNADLTSVEPNLLTRAVGKLEFVQFEKTQLTDQQSEMIYTALAGGGTRLKSLVVRMCPLEKEVMARAMNNLEYFGASIGKGTAEAILTQSLDKTSLKKIRLWIRGTTRIDQSIVTEARKVIKEVVVRHMDIVGAQHV